MRREISRRTVRASIIHLPMDAWLERYKGYILVAILVLIVVGGGVLTAQRPGPKPLEIQAPTVTPTIQLTIKVYVSGEVANPGVYAFKSGDRVDDAVAAAGGFTPEANRNGINLAARLSDGQQIIVPKTGENAPSAVSPGGSLPAKVNINTATLAELDTLPGIGQVTGQKILDFRAKNGPFQRLEDLKDQKLVPASTFDKIKDLITL